MCVRAQTAASAFHIMHASAPTCFYRTLLNVNHIFPGYFMFAMFIREKKGGLNRVNFTCMCA